MQSPVHSANQGEAWTFNLRACDGRCTCDNCRQHCHGTRRRAATGVGPESSSRGKQSVAFYRARMSRQALTERPAVHSPRDLRVRRLHGAPHAYISVKPGGKTPGCLAGSPGGCPPHLLLLHLLRSRVGGQSAQKPGVGLCCWPCPSPHPRSRQWEQCGREDRAGPLEGSGRP